MDTTALVAVAQGSEEMEAVITIDVLRRAGIKVTVASCSDDGSLQITASRGVHLVADRHIDELLPDAYDVIVLAGGMPGAENLRNNAALGLKLKQQRNHSRWIAAICAAPAVVLLPLDLLGDGQATCHPSFHDKMPPTQLQARDPVVVESRCQLITSQGPGTAFAFALTIIETLLGQAKANEVAKPLVLPAAAWPLVMAGTP